MIVVSVYYPKTETSTFDIDYYCTKHMPLVQQKCGAVLKRMAVEHGIAGGAPGSPPPNAAVGHLWFDSVADFQAAFGPHTREIMADIPNYTNIQPVIQISEVRM